MKNNLSGLIQFAREDTQKATFSGSVYRKQLAKFGDWVNPQYPALSSKPIMKLDLAWAEKIVENFNRNTLGAPVPVPLNHTNEVEANTGRVQSLEIVPGDGLYGNLVITNEKTVEKLDKGEIFDVSISFDWNHIRTDDNKNYGPTLLHCALVNNPYLLEMNTFEKVGTALSRLEESFKPVGLSFAGRDVIMLSRDTMKELSNMATKTLKNDKGFAVTVKFKDGDEDKELVVEPGEDVIVPEDAADEVTTQLSEAEESTDENATDESNEAGGESGSEADQGETNEGEAEELSRLRKENTELRLSKSFDDLLSQGKVIPAQRDKFMELSKLDTGVQLSKDKDAVSVVLDLLSTGSQQFSTEESGSSKEDENASSDNTDQSDEGKKPSELLTEEDTKGLQALGVTPEQMDKMAAESPLFAKSLVELSKSNKNRKVKK